jgi:hypothetical protein
MITGPKALSLDLSKHLPLFAYSGQKGYSDIPIPTFDDIEMYFKPYTPPVVPWSEKMNRAVFRGAATGCGYTPETNQRLKLATMRSDLLDVGITKKTASLKFDPIHGLGDIKAKVPVVPFMDMNTQATYKYIIHVDGNVLAYRLLKSMLLDSVILRVKSPYIHWLDADMKSGKHYIEVKEDLSKKLDDYINYMSEEWFKENQLAIEKGLRAEIVEDFIVGLKGLFEEHYIDIPEDKVDVVEGLTSKVEELEESLNEQITRSIEMKKELNEHKKIEAIYTACEGLTQTQVEKMKSLAEGVEFTTEEEFNGKLETLKESYFKSPVKSADNSALDDEVQLEEETKKPSGQGDALIEQYAKTISQTLK